MRRVWVVVRRGRVTVPGSVLTVLVAATACSGSHATDPVSGAPPASSITLSRCVSGDATAATRGGMPDITLACLGKGPAVSVARIAGPAVVNLWASWCYPCRQEMPLLQHESEALGGKVRIVGVDTNDQAAHAVAFAEDTVRASYEEFSDPTGKLAISLHAPGLPFTVAVDRSGSLVWSKAGQVTAGDISHAIHAAEAGNLCQRCRGPRPRPAVRAAPRPSVDGRCDMRIRAPAHKAGEAPNPSALPRRVRLLLDASLALSTEHDLDVLLRRFTAIACELIDARYGALLVEDIGTLVTFVTHGITEEQHALIGEPPSRTGLHGQLLREGKTVVIDDLLSDPRTIGYPPYHPAMRSFLGTPIRAGARVIGELYLADKRNGRRFDDADVEIVEALAAVAGVAYRNARLLQIQQQSAAHAQAMLDLRAKGNLDEMMFWSQVWAREDERARLARDIHDEQGQILTSLILFAKHLEQQIDSEIAPQVSGLRQLAEQALRAARTLAQQLRPLELDQLGLVPALNRLVEHTAQGSGIAVDFVAGPQQVRLTYALEVVVYRIAQQALTNVARHSHAQSASVTLSGRDGWLTLIIEDDGAGFDCDAVLAHTRDVAHMGIRTMRDRARSVGGDLVVESDRGSGTLVRLRVPTSGEPVSSEHHTPARPQTGPRRRASRHDPG